MELLQHKEKRKKSTGKEKNANFPMLSVFYTSVLGDNSSSDIFLATDVVFMDPEL